MDVERSSLIAKSGVPDLAPGCFLKFDSDVGEAAWITWSKDGDVRFSLYAGPRGRADLLLIDVWGRFDPETDSFELQARDERAEAGSREDVETALAAFRQSVRGMSPEATGAAG